MKTLIAEQPLILALLLAVIAAAILWGWLQSGKKAALLAGLLVLALIPISWYVSNAWVTDREQIRAAIESTAEAVRNNDFDRAIQVIEPRQRELIASARADLSRFRFNEARVNQIRDIQMVEGSAPPEAEVDLTVTVVVSDQRGTFTEMRVPRRVLLSFRKSADGNWYVYRYNHMPPIGAADAYTPNP